MHVFRMTCVLRRYQMLPWDGARFLAPCSHYIFAWPPVLREMGVDGHVHAGIMRGRLYPTSTARLGSLVSYLRPEGSACSYPPSALVRLVMSSLSLSLVLFLWRDQSGVCLYNRHSANAGVAAKSPAARNRYRISHSHMAGRRIGCGVRYLPSAGINRFRFDGFAFASQPNGPPEVA